MPDLPDEPQPGWYEHTLAALRQRGAVRLTPRALSEESPCTDIPLPGVPKAADFAFPSDDELEALALGLPADWSATIWLMYGCGLRIGEALAVRTRCRISKDTVLRVREQVNPVAQLRPLKFG